MRWHEIAGLLKDPKVGVEVGVKEGKFSAHLLSQFSNLHMIGVDPYEAQESKDELGHQSYADWNFSRIMSDMWKRVGPYKDRFTLYRDYSVDAAPKVEDGSADFVFIDALHTYNGVKEDIALWKPKVKPGGILCGHDYDFTRPRFADVIKAVDESFDVVNTAPDHVWWVRV